MVELVLKGNIEAFEPLVTPYRKILLTMAFRLSQNWEDAKEISQDTLLRAFRYLKSYDPKKSFKNWLLQILVNVSRNQRKKRIDPQRLAALSIMSHEIDPAEKQFHQEARSQLLKCLDGLSPREREIFLLRDIEDMSIEETARALTTSSIAVRVHLSSARKKIKERVKEKFPHLLEGRR